MRDPRMAGRADALRSRIVVWLKIGLPLAALALLSTLFLLSRGTDPALTADFMSIDAVQTDTREQVRNPSFSGTSPRGDLLTMTASRAWPSQDGSVLADRVSGAMALQDGSRIELGAGRAILGETDRRITLEDGVTIESSAGYALETGQLITQLDDVTAIAPGPVQGSGPVGTLEAGSMRIERNETDGDIRLLFTDGVRLVYTPQP